MDDEAWHRIDCLLGRCKQGVGSVNAATSVLLGGGVRLLKPLSLPRPTKSCAELVFFRTLFWLSALFHECGGRALRFCIRQTQFADPEGDFEAFLSQLRALRTQAAHNLDANSQCDITTDTICRNWFRRVCRSAPPINNQQWNFCATAIIDGAIDLLTKLETFLNALRVMTESDLLREGLNRAIAASISPYAFDDLVELVAEDLGRSDLSLEKFRADNLQKWIDALEKLPEGYNFRYEARRVVEKSFVENPERPPITGRDIIEILGVQPGREVGRLLELAHQFFQGGIREKDSLLHKLNKQIDSAVSERTGDA